MKIYTNINENIPKNCISTIGFFDGVHLGHQFLIKHLQEKAFFAGIEDLVISLWPHPSIHFGRPIKLLSTYSEKIKLFESIGVKNLLILDFNNELANTGGKKFTDEFLIKKLTISELVMGYNNSFGKKGDTDFDNIKKSIPVSFPQEFTFANNIKVNSSTIRIFLENGEVEDANKFLGYNFSITGSVVSGYQIGRTIGFPTANLGNIDEYKLIPANGVYICTANVNNKSLPAMLNIGTRPSFNGQQLGLEFHIPDFNSDLYGHEIQINFLKRIRSEIKFDTVDDLIVQLNKDKEDTQAYFK
ncbi:MAG: riboflavin biosynthesis protein RibF [Bacteroidales bacterium]|nr:riboflavin biosynthesis protein RibF [Bacteroidales bacterium]MDD4216231.1 riboflavin biosynthesis protein RibF [Bacteroidales bacterium]MDY0141389.1 riboflavin biosynthesis protein RibF [Bacteroidales bacterium]